jgi:hypothetical protein
MKSALQQQEMAEEARLSLIEIAANRQVKEKEAQAKADTNLTRQQ